MVYTLRLKRGAFGIGSSNLFSSTKQYGCRLMVSRLLWEQEIAESVSATRTKL